MGLEPLLDRRLVFVTGKGGVGKTTVAAALAVAAARSGRRTIVCELAAQQRLPDAFGHAGTGHGVPVELGPGLSQLSLEPAEALREWLRRQPGGAAAAVLLSSSSAFQQFVAAGPGVKELITIGKLGDLVDAAAHDVVVVDAPASGHVLGLLTAPRTFAAIARRGRIHRDADELWHLVRDRRRTAYVGVALPEEMPVRELVEFDTRLDEELGLRLDAAVVNEVWPDRYTERDAARLRAAKHRMPDARSAALLSAALDEHRRAHDHRRRIADLRTRLTAPVVALPELLVPRLGPDQFARLGDILVPAEPMPARRAA
jgi:anion-transporting  ArsA/GET3 family ATPase